MNEELIQAIESILSQSDIVWSRYGSETTEELAKKIVRKVEEIEESKSSRCW